MPWLGQSELLYQDGTPVARLWGDGEAFWVDLPNVGQASIRKKRINLFGDDLERLQPFLWGRILSLFLELNSVLVFHGCVAKVGERAVLFCGPKGTGKSTLSYYLSQAGFPTLSDDLAPTMPDMTVLPGMPSWKLWPSSMPDRSLARYKKVHDELEKRIVPGDFWQKPLVIGSVIFLNPTTDAEPKLKLLRGGEGLIKLVANSFQTEMLQSWPENPNRLKRIAEISGQIPIFSLSYTRELEKMRTLIHYLKENNFGINF